MNYLISYHKFLVEAWLFVIVLNIVVPMLFKKSQFKFIQTTRIGFFAFWALWAMAIFSGTIVFVFAKAKVTAAILFMIIASIILPILDGYRAIKLTKLWRSGELGLAFSLKVLTLEVIIIAAVVIYTIIGR